MIQSGFLEESYAEEMKAVNEETAQLLRKVEGCKVLTVDSSEIEYDVDLTWMESVENAEKKVLKSVEIHNELGTREKKEYNEKGQLRFERSNYSDTGEYLYFTEHLYSDKGIKTDSYFYDESGRLISTTKYEYDDKGNLSRVYDYIGDKKLSNYQEYEYDDVEEKIQERKIRYSYRDTELTNWDWVYDDRSIYYEYDEAGNVLELYRTVEYYSGDELVYGAERRYYEYQYDLVGNMTEEHETVCYERTSKNYKDWERWWYYIYEYDTAGNIMTCRKYQDNKLVSTTYYTYYEKDELEDLVLKESTEEEIIEKEGVYYKDYVLASYVGYRSNGDVAEKMSYTCDSTGDIVSSELFDSNGEKIATYEYVYEQDFRGNELKKINRYKIDGSFDDWEEHEYDESGKEIRARFYGSDGKLFYYFDYEYDETGKLIHTIKHYAGSGTEIDYDYEYDNMGNCIKMYMNNIYGEVTHWYEYEYDEHGNLIMEVVYEASGELYAWKEYQYVEINVDASEGLTEDEAYEKVKTYWESLGKNMPSNVECEGITENGYCFWGYNMTETHANTHFRICVDIKNGRLYDVTYDKYLN